MAVTVTDPSTESVAAFVGAGVRIASEASLPSSFVVTPLAVASRFTTDVVAMASDRIENVSFASTREPDVASIWDVGPLVKLVSVSRPAAPEKVAVESENPLVKSVGAADTKSRTAGS